jgi:DNA-binding CsgD family transcriptional regulator
MASIAHPRAPVSDNRNGKLFTRHLTPTEIRVIGTLAKHLCSNPRLAEIMGLRLDTIKHHLYSIMTKTGTFSRLELVVKWQRPEFQNWLREVGIL